MNIFSWTVTLEGNKNINLDFDFIESLSKSGDKIVFIFGETELKTSKEVIDMFKEKLWEIKNFDISISTEDKIEVVNVAYEEGIYEVATFEWEEVTFAEIMDRFSEFEEVISIREAELSSKFWNKTIKVDFVY